MLKKRALLNNVVLVTLLLSFVSPIVLAVPPSVPLLQGAAWWDSNWQFRKEISIDHNNVDADLENFPVLISFDSDADLASHAQTGGDDIVFTDTAGNQLNHEIECYDNSTGQLVAWVNVPSVTLSVDTVLFIYYGNSNASNQENVAGVWDSNYVLVQHLEETSGTHHDSTSSGNDGTPTGGVAQDATGKIDGADDFDGTDDYVDFGNDSSLDILGSLTVEAWALSENGGTDQDRIVSKDRTGVVGKFILWRNGSGDLEFQIADPSDSWYKATGPSVSNGVWMHVVGVYDAENQKVRLYKDGVPVAEIDGPLSMKSSSENVTIGASHDNAHNWDGIIEEVRISNGSKSADWILTSYRNMNAPDSFYSVGLEQEYQVNMPPAASDESPADGAEDVSVYLSELSFVVTDSQGDLIDYNVSATPDIIGGVQTGAGITSGTTIAIPITQSPLEHSSVYTWTVDVTDPDGSGTWTSHTFTFTTKSPPPAFAWWSISDPHIQTDLPDYRSLESAILDSRNGGDQGGESFDWDIATVAGDWTGNQQCPGDDDGQDLIDQWAGAGADPNVFYGIIGNHDAGASDNWWFEKWVDPLGQHTAYSGIDSSQRPYPVEGEWDHYSFEVGNILFLMLGDRNEGPPPFGRECSGGYPAGRVTLDAYNWWVDQVESHPDRIIVTVSHQGVHDTTIYTGFDEGYEQGIHGGHSWADRKASSMIYAIDNWTLDGLDENQNYIGDRDFGFEKYLQDHPGAIDFWIHGHSHDDLYPGKSFNGRSDVETKYGVTFVNTGGLTKQHAGAVAPFSRVFYFYENSQDVVMKTYMHSNEWDSVPEGFYAPAEITVQVGEQFDPNYVSPLEIQDISVSPGTQDATISWKTNLDADSTVQYGETVGLGNVEHSSTQVRHHEMVVAGLASDTLYYYSITSCSGGGECVTEGPNTFTTRAIGLWQNQDWPHRKELVIDHAQVTADLVGFPILVDVTDVDLGSKAQTDGDDIFFTDSFGTQLAHEIERYDSGHLVAWVNVPFLSSATDTTLYMYYGNPAAGNQENPSGVWDSHYVMVQHLDETSGTHHDSTINGNDGTPQNGLIQDVIGKMDGADDFTGVNEFIDVGSDPSMDVYGPNQDFSVFLWVRRDSPAELEGFFSSGSSGENGIYFGSAYENESELRFMSLDSTVRIDSNTAAIGDTDWHYVGVTADRNGNLDLWVDGESVHSESIAAHAGQDWNRQDDTYKIGTDRSEDNPMDGIIDEPRVSDVVRSAGWISTGYNNMSDPDTFLHIGPEQTIYTPLVTNESPADGAEGVSVSLSELSFHIEDPEREPMDYTVTTEPDIGAGSGRDVSDGTYAVPVSGLGHGVTYTWYVTVTDGAFTTTRQFTFATEVDLPIISDKDPEDGALYVPLNPTLRADILDEQGEPVDWEISVLLGGSWQLMDSGTLSDGCGTVSATTTGVDEYDTTYSWRIRIKETESMTWVQEVYTFQTLRNEINFAAFTDTHVGALIETSWGMADHLDSLAQDIMNNTVPCDFVVHLGDIVMHSAAYVEGEHLPAQYDQYKNNVKAFLWQHVNIPFMAVSGNHDLNDYYGENHAGYPENGHDPFNLVREIIDSTEMNSYPYSFMRNNILFIALPETDYHHFTKPIIYEYVEYMTQRYPNNTTIIFSHQAIEDTTIHDGSGSSTYRGKQDREWWAELFRNNPQIKMWIHGHQHMLDWYQSDHSTADEDFGHEMVFSMPYSQADWGGYFEEDRIVIYTISPDGISSKAWENNGAGGRPVPDYDHNWEIQTTYNKAAQDWYSFPIFIQDGEIQKTDLKAFSPNMTLELIGTQPMELFYDPTMATQGTSWGGENILGFGNDLYSEATPTLPGMTVHGPADLNFPPKYPGSAFQGGSGAYHEDGRTGQPYHFFPVGTTHAAVPGATYEVVITARSNSGSGTVHVDLSVSDWGTASQYSTLAGSTLRVISHTFGTSYETVSGTYTVPNDDNAWFLQGYLDFLDSTDYDVSLFSIKRLQDTLTTDNFGLSLNGTGYNHSGTLQPYDQTSFKIDPATLADGNGVIEITSSIDGNHFGMARVIYHAPLLMGRNARFTVNSVSGNNYNITLQQDLSYYLDTFKMFPFSRKYGTFQVTSDDGSAEKKVSANGNEWIESNTPTEITKVTLDIEYGPDAPTITDASPASFATDVEPNPTLEAYILDLQGDQVDWEIKTNAGGTWQTINSGTLLDGEGVVSATPTNMAGYDTTYYWSVSATDPGGSGETVEEIYQFTTRLENYLPSLSNPFPEDGATFVPLNPILSIDTSDFDGDLLDIVFKTDASGTWQDIATYTGVGDGTYTATTVSMAEYATTYNWRVEVDDGSGVADVTYSLTTVPEPGSWWDAAWLYRKEITIDHNGVDEDLCGFPVLIDLTDPDLATYAQAGGDDIVFTDEYGRQSSHEIEEYDGATGHLIAWVKVPDLSSSENTVLYMYFGNDTAGNQEDIEGTWDNGHVMVHHLQETAGTHFDSTANHNDGTTVVVTDQDAIGKINGADEFDGTDDYVRVENDASLQFGEGNFTAEAWIYPHPISDIGGARIVNNRGTGGGGSYKGYQLKINDQAGRWYFDDASIDDATGNYMAYEGTTTYSYNQWYQVVMVYDADNQLIFYVNGAPDGTLPVNSYGSLTNALPTAIGASLADAGVEGADDKQFFDGVIDEVKLSNTARSAGWISTGYNNQSDPGAFYSVGELELASGPPEISNPLPAGGATDVSVALSHLSFDLHDPDGDLMDYVVTTTPDVGSDSGTAAADGTYTVPVAGLTYETMYTWAISVTDGISDTYRSYSFTTQKSPGLWWNADWVYRKKITIDHTQVAEDLTNFAVLVEIDDGSLATFVQDDADDIAFTDYDGAQLDHEIERYDAPTGALVAWVRVPSLSSTEDTILYMYYGNSEAGNQENPEGVWDSDYVLVQHLDETDGTHFDSTAYDNDGTPHNLASQDAPGKIDGADEFHDSGDLIDVGTDPSLDVFGPNQDFSVFLWAKRDEVENVDGFFSSGSSWENGVFFGTAWGNLDDLRFFSPGNTVDITSTVEAVGDTNWHYVGLTADRDGYLQFWVDGDSVLSTNVAAYAGENWNRLDDTYKIGTDRSESGSMDGILDEVRVSRIARSPGWIQTSYNNQADPSQFYSIAQEPVDTYQAPTVTLVSPADGATQEIPVSFSYLPECYSPGGCTRAELWLNLTETHDGGVVYTDNTYAPQRAVIKDGKLYQSEGTGHGCRITVRNFPEGDIEKQSPVFGGGNHSNTSVIVDQDVIYGICTDGVMQAWNQATESVVWQINVGPGGSYSTTSNSMEVDDGYIYVQSADFVIHKIRMADGVKVDSMALDSTGGLALKAHMLVDYDNDRLYALGDSNYYAIDLATFTQIWSLPIVAGGGRQTRGGPILVDDANSGQYLTIFTTFPQDHTYAVDFNGNVVWTWTEKPARASATYNPNTGLIYVTDATGYTDSGVNLPLPGSIYALHVDDGSVAWVSHGDGSDKFARPVTASGNYLIFKTDNNGSPDYLYVLDATTGEVLAKISAGGDRGYWCFPPALSGGYVATGGGYTDQGGNVLDIYHVGDGDFVDYYPLHGNIHHTGYVPGGLTSLGLTSTSWQLAKVSDVPVVSGTVNSIEFDFGGYPLPQTSDWNIKVIQSDNQSALGVERQLTVLPENQPPAITDPSPSDGAVYVSTSTGEVTVEVTDPEGDGIDWRITTSPDVGSCSGTGEPGGAKICSISGLSHDTTYTWDVQVTDPLGSGDTVTDTFTFATEPETAAWYDDAWLYRKAIIIDHTLVDADLINFPVLIRLTDSDLADKAQSDGDDILFTDVFGTKLDHEIETFDDTAGELVAWVRVPFLSSTQDTVLYMYYGNPDASSQEYVQGVWDSNFVMVHHLKEIAGSHYDSTFFDNDGTTVVVTDQDAAGKINGADEFDGTNDYVRVPDDTSLQFGEESLTAQAWIYPRSVPDPGGARVVNNRGTGPGGSYRGYQLKIKDESGQWRFGDAGIDDATGNYRSYDGTSTYSYNHWYHIVMVYDAGNELRFYVNGSPEGTLGVGSYESISNALPTVIGASLAHQGVEGADDKQFFDGLIDEVRLSDIARSAEWISTEFKNQNDTNSFYHVGNEETHSINIPLNTGWNLISIPRVQSDTAITEVLASIDGYYDLVYAYDGCGDGWQKYDVNAAPYANSLTDLDHNMGFWVRVSRPVALIVEGTVPNSTMIPMCEGWNLVGYPSETTRDVLATLSGVSFDLAYAYDAFATGNPWQKYDVNAAPYANSLTEMTSARGYWIRTSANGGWTVEE